MWKHRVRCCLSDPLAARFLRVMRSDQPLHCKQSEFAHDERISQNAKYETRNKFEMRMTKIRNSSVKRPGDLAPGFGTFGFRICFGFRFSDLVAANGRAKSLSWTAPL